MALYNFPEEKNPQKMSAIKPRANWANKLRQHVGAVCHDIAHSRRHVQQVSESANIFKNVGQLRQHFLRVFLCWRSLT